MVDLVILNERGASYVQDLQIALETLVRTSRSRTHLGAEGELGGIFVLRSDLISAETRALLLAVARVVLLSRRGGLKDQLDRLQAPRGVLPPARRKPASDAGPPKPPPPVAALAALQFFNGLGGFSPDGREYVTVLGPGQSTPAPWINVVSNPSFGFQVAVEGGGYTWSQNSRDNQLTPWSNDPVSDRPGEVLYVRDLDSGTLWTPTALPIRLEQAPYIVRHGRGYSRFEVVAQGIMLELLQYVPLADSLKISRLTIRNISDRPRRLSVTAFAEWVLGLSRGASAPTVVTERDAATGAIFARNPWSMHHGGRVAFADLGGRQTAWTADRGEFIGRNCTIDNPAALSAAIPLSQRVGAGLDPCAALQTTVELERGGTTEVVFFLGQAGDAAEAQALIERYRAADLDAVHREVTGYWEETLGAVQVKTPDRAMDILLNGPLLYQTLACRYWARSAFYQASGAYGFRDQLQDVMSLAVARPELAREHILRAAARQFVEGDFQHWWFPPAGQGVRTRISDDRAWLATVAAHYIETTGDAAILDEKVPFLDGPALKPGEHDLYFQPSQADEAATLYEHCARGLDLSLETGAHGLPLMGTGDWNDGMNRVGEAGRGESVWLGWFFHGALTAFAPDRLSRATSRRGRKAWKAHADALARSARPRRLGWRLVSPWLLRRRHAARFCGERGMPHRFHRPVLGGHVRRRRSARARSRRWRPSTASSCIAATGWRRCSPRRSTRPRWIPATSRAIRPVSARMAANTPMPPPGRSWALPRSARATRRPSCSRWSIPSTTPARARACCATRSSPMSWRRTSIPWRRMSGGAAGPGTRARPAGSIAPASRRSWASGSKAGHW